LSAESGAIVRGWAADVAQSAQVNAAVSGVLEAFGKIDILVNNAGITRDNVLVRMSEEQWDQVLDTNLKGAFNCLHAVVKPMMKAHYGRILNISSIVALTGNPGQSNYAAAKAGLIAMSKSLARELASRNILLNCLAPGFIDTDMTAILPEKVKEEALSRIPLARMGTPEDIARAAAFLVSPLNSYITGQVLAVDGGLAM
jgi:3-oxoacyl-[acyl-carrier protein] reductase